MADYLHGQGIDLNRCREATELEEIAQTSRPRSNKTKSTSPYQFIPKSVKTFWGQQVVATVAHDECRDHFGEKG